MKIFIKKKDGIIHADVFEKNLDLKIEQKIPLKNIRQILNRLNSKSKVDMNKERSFAFQRSMNAKINYRRKREGE